MQARARGPAAGPGLTCPLPGHPERAPAHGSRPLPGTSFRQQQFLLLGAALARSLRHGPGVRAVRLSVCRGSGRFLGRRPRPRPPPLGFTSPFRRQVEVWALAGVLFLSCCYKSRENQPPGSMKQVAGAWGDRPHGGGDRGTVCGPESRCPHRAPEPLRPRPSPSRPGCGDPPRRLAVPRARVRLWCPGLRARRPDPSGWTGPRAHTAGAPSPGASTPLTGPCCPGPLRS